jgi:hypothetical protein
VIAPAWVSESINTSCLSADFTKILSQADITLYISHIKYKKIMKASYKLVNSKRKKKMKKIWIDSG